MADDLFNLEGKLGVDDKGLDAGFARAEKKVQSAAEKFDKQMSQMMKLGKVAMAMEIIGTAGKVAFDGIGAAIDYFNGKISSADEKVLGLGESLKSLPIAGKFFEIGNAIGEGLFGDKADADRINKESKDAEDRSKKTQAEFAAGEKLAKSIERGIALGSTAGEADKKRLQAQFEFEDTTANIAKLPPALQERLLGLANTKKFQAEAAAVGIEMKESVKKIMESQKAQDDAQKKLDEKENARLDSLARSDAANALEDMNATKAWEEAIADPEKLIEKVGSAREFNARMFAGGITGGAQNDPPKGKQVQRTNELLSEIARTVGKQAAINVVAQ